MGSKRPNLTEFRSWHIEFNAYREFVLIQLPQAHRVVR
jgi:hypothetical protein